MLTKASERNSFGKHVDNGEFEVTQVASVDQYADFLTKLLHLEAFERHRDFIINIG